MLALPGLTHTCWHFQDSHTHAATARTHTPISVAPHTASCLRLSNMARYKTQCYNADLGDTNNMHLRTIYNVPIDIGISFLTPLAVRDTEIQCGTSRDVRLVRSSMAYFETVYLTRVIVIPSYTSVV
jgi:hypothetical protein